MKVFEYTTKRVKYNYVNGVPFRDIIEVQKLIEARDRASATKKLRRVDYTNLRLTNKKPCKVKFMFEGSNIVASGEKYKYIIVKNHLNKCYTVYTTNNSDTVKKMEEQRGLGGYHLPLIKEAVIKHIAWN